MDKINIMLLKFLFGDDSIKGYYSTRAKTKKAKKKNYFSFFSMFNKSNQNDETKKQLDYKA